MDRHEMQTVVDNGCWVKVEGFEPGEQEIFYLVEDEQVNLVENRISIKSPFARAVMGAKPGDRVNYQTRTGTIQLTVVDVGRI